MSNCTILNCESFYSILYDFFRKILYGIWPSFVKCLIFEWTVHTWWVYGFVKYFSTSLKIGVKFKSGKWYIRPRITVLGLILTRLKKDDSSDNFLISLTISMRVPTKVKYLSEGRLWRSWILHLLVQKKHVSSISNRILFTMALCFMTGLSDMS